MMIARVPVRVDIILNSISAPSLSMPTYQSLSIFEHSRLVEGTALALQLGHRKSIDLDMSGTIEIGESWIGDYV